MRSPAGDVLRKHSLRPKRSWGQNFLSDPATLRSIVAALGPTPESGVVELGAGLGHLTAALLETGASVVAVERDRELIPVLEELVVEGGRLEILEANATTLELEPLARGGSILLTGNLPYHLSASILFSTLQQRAHVARAVFTLQKEVVDRLVAGHGGRDYGILSVLLQLHFDVDEVCVLPASLFHPPPKVDSAVVRLERRSAPRGTFVDEARLTRVVKAAFAQRRKTLLNSLKSDKTLGDTDTLRRALETAGLEPGQRAETVPPEGYAALERALAALE